MTSSVWLVRHASTAWSGRRWCGRTDLPLTDVGLGEAHRLASRIVRVLPSDVELHRSPARRAAQTAEPIEQALGLRARVDPDLREVDFGRAEGLVWQQLEVSLPDLAANIMAGSSSLDWPGGDTALAVRERAAEAWRRFRNGPTDAVVLVTHGGFIAALIDAAGCETSTAMVPPASATELRRVGSRWTVVPSRELP